WHEPVASASLAGLEALDAWMRTTQRQVAAAASSPDHRVTDVFGFWQDGEWAIMLDPSYAQASDRKALTALSERFGLALSFIVETSGGCAFFDACREGQPLRRIQSIDGEVTAEGERLPQEAGRAESSYFIEETEALQLAFGITPPGRLARDKPVIARSYVDRTDYGAPVRARRAAAGAGPSAVAPPRSPVDKPWWRFW
ncbi:MAG: hypothetical protein ACJ8GJ_21705, partial [Vitreoscilla sp.]